jgi:hypothetical protein
MVGGYPLSRTVLNGTTVITSPNSLINQNGRASIDRAHNFKLTGSYLLPYDILVAGNVRSQSGQPYTRIVTVTNLPQAANGLNVNGDPRGFYTLPWLNTIDLRAGKVFHFGANEFEADMDVYNLTNSNAVFNVRTGTGLTPVTDFTTGQTVSIATFNSPIGVLGPRIVRFNVVYRFGQR